MTTAISGTRRQVRELVDGTLEVKVHIDPRFKADFHALFPAIDAPVALAPLAADFERRPEAPKVRPVCGPICQWLGARCKEPKFWDWLNEHNFDTKIDSEASAAHVVRILCDVKSRTEIDYNPTARNWFELAIRAPYARHVKGENHAIG